MLAINRLTVRSKLTKEELLRSVNFSVDDGETFGLIGESGSGKSMTSKCIMRLPCFSNPRRNLLERQRRLFHECKRTGRLSWETNQYDTAEPHDRICSHGEVGKTA